MNAICVLSAVFNGHLLNPLVEQIVIAYVADVAVSLGA